MHIGQVEWNRCHSSLFKSNNECKMAWDVNEYALTYTTADLKVGVYDDNTCETCSPGCYEWASSTMCMSWKPGYYLQF